MANDTLNDILVQCAILRNCYPLMHRTLHEFNWFVSVAIFGGDRMMNKIDLSDAKKLNDADLVAAIEDRIVREEEMHKKYYASYNPSHDELIKLARAFYEYCKEEYGAEIDGE